MHYGEIGEMAGRKGGGQEMENSMHYGEIGEMAGRKGGSGNGEFDALWRNRRNGWPTRGGVRKWRIQCILEKSEKCAGRSRGGQELENSMHYGEIGEIK